MGAQSEGWCEVKITDLIALLQTFPPYADVLFDDREQEEYCDIIVELGDDQGDAVLVTIGIERMYNEEADARFDEDEEAMAQEVALG